MNSSVVYLVESERWPLGKAWREYWNERNEGQTRKARKYISREKSQYRKRMHRRLRRDTKSEMRKQQHRYKE